MANKIESVATAAVYDNKFVREPGMCQKFVRQCIQSLYGDKYNEFHKGSALDSARAWVKSSFATTNFKSTKVGDIGYWTSEAHGPHGHVAIRVAGNKWAENSVVHKHNENGSKGFRSVAKMGRPDIVVRLPQLTESEIRRRNG